MDVPTLRELKIRVDLASVYVIKQAVQIEH